MSLFRSHAAESDAAASVSSATQLSTKSQQQHDFYSSIPRFDQCNLGGVSFQSGKRVTPDDELKVIRFIVLREELLGRLRDLLRRIEVRFDVDNEVLLLLQGIREMTIRVVDAITNWRMKFVCYL